MRFTRRTGGWTLHFYFRSTIALLKKSRLAVSALLLSTLLACAPERKAERPRAPTPRPVLGGPVTLVGRELSSQELISYFFEQKSGPSACRQLGKIPRAGMNEARFRILESARVVAGAGVNSDGTLKKKDCKWVCGNPLNWGSERCRLCNEEPIDLVDVWGRVGIGTHPVYEIALQSVEFPSRDEFMKLVSQERSKFGLVLLPFFESYRALIKIGIKDAIEMRNKIIQERVDQAFPGAFDLHGKPSKMEDSLSLALILNALPSYSTLLTLPSDTAQQKQRKLAVMDRIQAVLSKPLPFFRTDSWSDFSDDAITALNASVKSLVSRDPVEQACAVALLHRNFAQMIRIIGYSRLPTVTNSATGTSAMATSISGLLGSPDGVKLATCPAPGSFAKNGKRVIVSEKKLSDYATSSSPIVMSGKIEALARCARSEAQVYSEASVEGYAAGKPSAVATAEDHLALMRVLSHQLTAFNPSSDWWAKSPVGYPLGEFTDFETIERSGAVLPYQYHALALGLLQVSLDALVGSHLMQVDADFRETDVGKEVVGIRLSTRPRSLKSAAPVETSLDAALILAEVSFKAGAYLKQVPRWKKAHQSYYRSEHARLRTSSEKANYKRMNENFINGLFGAESNLLLLTGEKDLPGGINLQEQVDQLKVASAMLLASFALPAKNSTVAQPRYTCAASLVTDPRKGGELKKGHCTAAQERVWKQTFSWLSTLYKSPLFAGYAK